MSQWDISPNTDFAPCCSGAGTERSEMPSSLPRVNVCPVQHPALLLAARALLGQPQSHPALTHPNSKGAPAQTPHRSQKSSTDVSWT